jgi:hypothetical protein
MLLLCVLLFGVLLRRPLGDVATNFLCTTWVSTIILGTPILRAALGSAYAYLGIVAGISSFLFQLPVQASAPRTGGSPARASGQPAC